MSKRFLMEIFREIYFTRFFSILCAVWFRNGEGELGRVLVELIGIVFVGMVFRRC